MENEANQNSSHHHHHHHHHKSSRKKKFSLKRFVRKYKTPLRIVALVLAFVLTAALAAYITRQTDNARLDGSGSSKQPTLGAPQVADSHVAVTVTRFDAPVPLFHEVVSSYLSASISLSAEEFFSSYQQSGSRLDQGQPVTLSYEVLGLRSTCTVTGFRVEVTEQGQNEPLLKKACAPGENSVQLYNLKSGTVYQYAVRADFNIMDSITVSGTFETAAGPRLLKVDGIGNVRDFGGWKVGGTIINQGLLYRGSELDGVVEATFNLTEAGRNTLLNELGVRMEMDLRQTAERSEVDRLGGSVICPDPYNAPYFDGVFESNKTDSVCRIFRDLANPDNYPIYMHCTFGRDRTGTVCLILGAVLGMEEDALLREYGLSALYYGDADYANARAVLAGLKSYGGQTLKEQAENYLLQIGITPDEIASLREIYLG